MQKETESILLQLRVLQLCKKKKIPKKHEYFSWRKLSWEPIGRINPGQDGTGSRSARWC